jgi:acyl-coenzyme A thioesterase PaaI-like protein
MADEQTSTASTTGDQSQSERLNDSGAYQRCFACGARNDIGLRLVFEQMGDEVTTEFTADERYQGFPGVVHGGILATLLDETLNRLAMAEGRMMMTGRLDIRYRQAAPVGQPLRVSARVRSSRARMLQAEGEIRLANGDGADVVIATAAGIFLPVPDEYQRDASTRFPEFAGFFDLQ